MWGRPLKIPFLSRWCLLHLLNPVGAVESRSINWAILAEIVSIVVTNRITANNSRFIILVICILAIYKVLQNEDLYLF